MIGYAGLSLLFIHFISVTSGEIRSRRNVVKDPDKIWPTWQIPITIQSSISRFRREQIMVALARISRRTCLTFPERKNEPDYIHILMSTSGCSSDLGRQGGKQTIEIGRMCSSLTNIAHEMMHALGFMHEHQRPDRDKFIEVVWDNIESGMAYNFRKGSADDYTALGPYDYNSLMHYRATMFSKNGGKTLRAKRPVGFIGFMNDLSEIDVWKINMLYKCNQTVCTHPALPAGSMLRADNIDVGRAKVEYSCKNNSQDIVTKLVGSRYRFCTKSAEWSGRLPACLESVSHYCDFDEEQCGWTQETGDHTDWLWKKGKADSSESGPYQDHSLGFRNYGRYMLLSSHGAPKVKKAIMKSPSLALPSDQRLCLRYYYYMSGYRMGNLQVMSIEHSSPGVKKTLAWHFGNQGDNWLEENIQISSSTQYVIFSGVTNVADESDIAIDDVMIAPCSSLMRSAHQSYYATGLGKIVVSDVDGDKSDNETNVAGAAPTAFTCHFNKDDCSVSKDSSWSVVSPVGSNDASLPCHRVHCGKSEGCMNEILQALQRIDPTKEETVVNIESSKKCSQLCVENPKCAAATYAVDLRKCYEHFEAVPERVNLDGVCVNHYVKPLGCEKVGRYAVSKGNGKMETAVIQMTRSVIHCICFYYYLDDMASSLRLSIQEYRGTEASAYYSAGDFKLESAGAKKKWKHAFLEVDLNTTYRIRFDSKPATPGESVVALDDVMVYEGACSFVEPIVPESKAVVKGFDCNFDTNVCGWKDSTRTQYNWIRNRGSTATWSTGPPSDHTSGRGYYVYAEASSRRRGTYSFESPEVHPTGRRGWCFTVYYHMRGRNMGSLAILYRKTEKGSETETRLAKITGDQGRKWKKKQIRITLDHPFKVIIRATIGNGSKSDIGIDDVSIIRGRCTNTCVGKKG